MHVAGGADRHTQLFSHFHDLAVEILKILVGVKVLIFFKKSFSAFGVLYVHEGILAEHETVVSHRLNFQIIIEFRNFGNFLVAFFVDDGVEKLALFAGRSVYQPLAILL